MPVIERESEKMWNQWVNSLERFMDGAEGFLYGAYRVVRWPVAGLWGLGRGLLQWATILSEPEPPAPQPTHFTLDLRGRWYTGTSFLNRFNMFRRFHHWLLAWYNLNPERMTRWYGEGHQFSDITFSGAMERETASDLFQRMKACHEHFRPAYHIERADGVQARLPALDELCRVHFVGDYDELDAVGLLKSTFVQWLYQYPFDIQFSEPGQLPEHSRWYTIPKETRVKLVQYCQHMRLHGVMLNELEWLQARVGLFHRDGSLLPSDDAACLRDNFEWVTRHVNSFFEVSRGLNHYRNSFKRRHGISPLEHPSSMRYQNTALLSVVETLPKECLQKQLNTAKEFGDASRSTLLTELQTALERRGEIKQLGNEAVRLEGEGHDYERTDVGFWGFWQDLFGLVRLQPKSPEGVSPEAIQVQVGDGVSGVDDSMAPAGGPDNDKSRAVFPEPQQPPTREHTVPEVDSGIGALPVTPPV